MAELTSTVEKQPNQTTIRISGYLSSENAESLETAFSELGDAQKVLLDFRRDVLHQQCRTGRAVRPIAAAAGQDTEFRIVHPAPHFRKVFDIVGLSRDVGVYEGEGAAVSGW